jgi:hypothetical protein
MKTISFKVDEGLFHWLAGEARRLRRRKSELVRQVIDEWRRNGVKGSIHERMKDACGSIKGAPKDFASNPKYLKGLGR